MTISWPSRRAACIRRQAGDRPLRAGLRHAEAADDDRYPGAARARPRPCIDVEGPPPVGGALRQRAELRLLDQRAVGQVGDAQVLPERGRIADDDGAAFAAGCRRRIDADDRRAGALYFSLRVARRDGRGRVGDRDLGRRHHHRLRRPERAVAQRHEAGHRDDACSGEDRGEPAARQRIARAVALLPATVEAERSFDVLLGNGLGNRILQGDTASRRRRENGIATDTREPTARKGGKRPPPCGGSPFVSSG
jgi:hypothetical protein